MSIAIDRTQTRFIEDPNRFDNPTKPKRNTHKDDVQPETGHQSVNPGPWVTEIALGLTDATEEQRESVEAILESYYRLRPRYVTLRYPLNVVVGQLWEKKLPATEFREETVLDNKSLCFGEISREDFNILREHGSGFNSMGLPGVLSGVEDDLHKYNTNRAADLEDYKAPKKPKDKGAKAAKASKAYAITVSDRQLRSAYVISRRWPSPESKETFWTAVHHFISRLTRLTRKDDDLHKYGLSDDFQMEFMLKILERLGRKQETDAEGKTRKGTKRVRKPADFIRRMWENERKTELKEQTKARRITVSIDKQVEDADGEKDEIDLSDSQRYKYWARIKNVAVEQHAVVEQTKEEYEAACGEKLNTLDPALADLVGMVLAQQTQAEIGKRLRISQQAVSKRVKKATDLIKAMPNVVVS